MFGLMRLSTTRPFHIVRTARLAAKTSGDDMIGLSIGVTGNFRVRQDGRLNALTDGGTVFHQARSQWELVTGQDTEIQIIKFSRYLLPPGARGVSDDSALALQAHSAAVNLFARYVDQLDRSAADLTALQRADAGQAAITLLVMALRGPHAAAPDGSDVVLLDLVKRYVREHVTEPFSLEDLARIHHVSMRQLYRLFEGIDVTPAAYVRRQRLQAGRDMLVDPRHIGMSIGRVAAMAGFSQVRTFNRAFLREFGTTPSDWRHDPGADPFTRGARPGLPGGSH
ncbi:AraC family transcriptional regulator [Actinoplanes sp. TBRC 11911]|uniref:AraC family transcriptional regulator n=1 Tax=Actinoplanes sp. TBRC 11911 TaxID=2729386 RepID=UPI00289A4055|nr:AraC family transcriptional regulator [Actinoplanes sp. TBRC 11911]